MSYPTKTGPTFEYDPDSGATTTALLQNIVDELVEIKTQPRVEFSREVWIDANGLTFIRTETRDEVTGAITVSYIDAGGNTVAPVAPFLPFASGDRELVKHCYTAIANGAGAGAIGWGASWGDVWGGFAGAGNQYSIGDKIIRINIIDPITGGTFQAFWFNETTGFYIAEPLQADLEVCTEQLLNKLVFANGVNIASGTLSSSYDPDGNGATWTPANASGLLQSFTVIAYKSGLPASPNSVIIKFASSTIRLLENETRTFSVAQDYGNTRDTLDISSISVVCNGDAAAGVTWMEVEV